MKTIQELSNNANRAKSLIEVEKINLEVLNNNPPLLCFDLNGEKASHTRNINRLVKYLECAYQEINRVLNWEQGELSVTKRNLNLKQIA